MGRGGRVGYVEWVSTCHNGLENVCTPTKCGLLTLCGLTLGPHNVFLLILKLEMRLT